MREILVVAIFVAAIALTYYLGRFVERRKSKQQAQRPYWAPPVYNTYKPRMDDYHINPKTGRVYLAVTEEYILKKYFPQRLQRLSQGETVKRYPPGTNAPVEVPVTDLQSYSNNSLSRQLNQSLTRRGAGNSPVRYSWPSDWPNNVYVGRANSVHLKANKRYRPKRKP